VDIQCVFGNLVIHIYINENLYHDKINVYIWPSGIVTCAVPVGNVSWILFQEGWSSNFRLRWGDGQAAHALAIIPTSSVLEFIVQ